MSSDRPQNEERHRWVRFVLATQLYAIAILEVQEVLASAAIEPVPGASAEVLGVINLRGSIVTVIDLRSRLGLSPLVDTAQAALIIVRPENGPPLGLAVDRVMDVVVLGDGEIQSPPAVGADRAALCLRGIVSREQGLLSLIDLSRLIAESA